MATHEELYETLRPRLSGLNKARIKFLSMLILALIKSNTISYEYLAREIETQSKLASVYRSIQRFFALFEIDSFVVAKLIASLVPIGSFGWILAVDRTNWKFGKKNINFLVLAVAYEGVAIPLFWVLLDKRGNSNWRERIDLTRRFIACFGKDAIECLTADREFIGCHWLKFLKKEKIPICIGTKDNILIADRNGVEKHGSRLFSNLAVGEYSILERRRTMGLPFDIVGCRLESGEYLILLCTFDAEMALQFYRARWEIETLFSCFKLRGFNFEATRATDFERLSRIFAVMAITLCWVHNVGEMLNYQKEIPLKKHGRKSKSIFRLGLEQLAHVISSISIKKKEFELMVELFSLSITDLKNRKYEALTW